MHALSLVLDNANILLDRRRILLLDFSNAFNNVDNGYMFLEVRNHLPSMAVWMESCYEAQSSAG